MYSLDVNFLKDRYGSDKAKIADSTRSTSLSLGKNLPLIAGLAAMILLPALTSCLLLLLNLQQVEAQKRIEELDAELGRLNAQNQNVANIEQQIAAINEETKSLVTVFNQIKPWSAILQEIRNQIPAGVKISAIQQNEATQGEEAETTTTNITITGFANSYNAVNDFLLTLQGSDFLNAQKTQLVSAKLGDYPFELENPERLEQANLEIEFPKGVEYTITTELNDIAASQLLRELASNGAIGLVTRIRTLEQKGAIQP